MAFEPFNLGNVYNAAAQVQGVRNQNALAEAQMQREAAFNPLFQEYLAGDRAAGNEMLAVDPERAMPIMEFQQSQNELAAEKEREEAGKIVRYSQFVLDSDNPKRLLTTAFPEYVGQLAEQGIDVEELTDEQVKTMAQGLIEYYGPMAEMSPTDITGEPDNVLVEIADPDSPTGTTYVPRSEAVGQPGQPPSGMNVTVGPDGTVQLTQGRFGGQKPPAGYRWADDGQTQLEPIPGGPATKPSGEMTGKLAGIEQAQEQDVPFAIEQLFGGDLESGELNRQLVAPAANRVGVGRDVRQAVERAISAIVRMESGAAVPDQELERYMSQYMPNILDTDRGARRKLQALQTRMENAIRSQRGEGAKPASDMSDDELLKALGLGK